MGPYPGSIKPLSQMKETNDLAWELFMSTGDVHRVIEVNAQNPSWMIHVQCARHEQEQNLETFQVGEAIYYRTTTRIHPGQELLVWYGSDINQYMGVPEMSYPGFDRKERQQIEGTTRHSNIPSSNGRLKCVVCSRGFNSRSNLRSHMRIHTMERPFVCEYCSRSFSQSSTLRNHLRLHTGEKPYKCHMCRSAYSQLAGLRAHQKSSRHKPSSTSQGSSHAED
ncbi:PR domain zinc finger protein 12-like isoform X2 [Centruroides vittatus]|nr:PR domain zinc finger protein 12-like isoform X2 [Centruroides sculpturatus]